MSKENANVEFRLGITVEAIRSAAKNASDIQEVVLDVPCINPLELNIDSEIYGLKVVPVIDGEKSKPSTLCTIGVIKTNVDTLSGTVKPGYVTINSSLDIPKEMGRTNHLKDIYFANKEDARQVALVFVEDQYNRSQDAVKAAEKTRDFLKEQFEQEKV